MAYIPEYIIMDSWFSPRAIVGSDRIVDLDESVNYIISDDNALSLKKFYNQEMAKLPQYLADELIKINAEVENTAILARQYRDEAGVFRNETEVIKTETGTIRDDTQAIKDDTQVIKDDTQTIKDDTQAIHDNVVVIGNQEVARVVGEGDTQTARVTTEGDTQVARTISEGDTQDTRVINEGNTQVTRVVGEGNTQVARVETEGDSKIHLAQIQAWYSEAEAKTADSYANEAHGVLVKKYTSNGDGTFSFTNTTDYSALHWGVEASFNDVRLGADNIFVGNNSFTNPIKADDLTSLDGTVTQLIKEIANKGYVDQKVNSVLDGGRGVSGTSNMFYLKFDDGTMIQWGLVANMFDCSSAQGSVWRGRSGLHQFVKPFHYFSGGFKPVFHVGTVNETAWGGGAELESATGFRAYAFSGIQNQTVFVQVLAIGRWKAV